MRLGRCILCWVGNRRDGRAQRGGKQYTRTSLWLSPYQELRSEADITLDWKAQSFKNLFQVFKVRVMYFVMTHKFLSSTHQTLFKTYFHAHCQSERLPITFLKEHSIVL